MDTITLTDLATIETEKAYDKFVKRTDRTIKAEGYGATVGGLSIVETFLGELSACVLQKLGATRVNHRDPEGQQFVHVIRDLPVEKVALCALQGALHAIGQGLCLRDTMLHLGHLVAAECWGVGLLKHDKKLAAKVQKAASKRGTVKVRRQAARSMAARAGFRMQRWPNTLCVYAGQWLLNLCLETMPHVFCLYEQDNDSRLGLTEGAEEIAHKAIEGTLVRNPVFCPATQPPAPWTGWASADRYNATLLRSHHKDRISAVKHAIATGAMQPTLDGINALQNVAWAINGPVLDVMAECVRRRIDVPGLPGSNLELPKKRADWATLDDGQKQLHRWRISQVIKRNRELESDRLSLSEDMETARLMLNAGRFWTHMNMDWRGRVYALSHFNFQREDRVRGLFLFADGAPITEEGIRWLKIHTANCGAFEKIDKQPLTDRVAWVNTHLDTIRAIAQDPLGTTARSVWPMADSPFLFLASCIELHSALTNGPGYVTHLPVSFDGTCSGLQHLAAMTRDEHTAALVNLLPSETPSDVYAVVAEKATANITADETDPALASLCLDYGVGRKEAKRNVMTYAYSSKVFGMACQQQEDLMEPLKREVLEGKREEHPFEQYAQGTVDRPGPAARYLAKHNFAAIEETVHRPAQAMQFLQKLARAMAHEAKPLRWTTPTGMPWINRYHPSTTERLSLWLHDKGVKRRYRTVVATGEEKAIDKDRAANGVAPNFVHALDAAHLSLTAGAAHAEGIRQLATIHDSFGCLACHATRFNQIIREQFAGMYSKHDVLAEVLEQAKCDLTQANWNMLRDVPDYGTLNINEVLNAQFAFA